MSVPLGFVARPDRYAATSARRSLSRFLTCRESGTEESAVLPKRTTSAGRGCLPWMGPLNALVFVRWLGKFGTLDSVVSTAGLPAWGDG